MFSNIQKPSLDRINRSGYHTYWRWNDAPDVSLWPNRGVYGFISAMFAAAIQ